MATESSHRLIMGKWLNCIFSITNEVMGTIFSSFDYLMNVNPFHVFNDQWPFCLVAKATLNLKKKEFFKLQLLQNHRATMTILVQMLIG